MTISELAKFMVESLGKERAEEMLDMLKEEFGKNTPETKVVIVSIGKKPNTEPEESKPHDDSYREGFMAGVNQFGSYMAEALEDFEPDPDAEDEE